MILNRGLRPVRALAESAARFGRGDFSVRMPPTKFVEIAPTVDAFNRMATDLERVLHQLRDREAGARRPVRRPPRHPREHRPGPARGRRRPAPARLEPEFHRSPRASRGHPPARSHLYRLRPLQRRARAVRAGRLRGAGEGAHRDRPSAPGAPVRAAAHGRHRPRGPAQPDPGRRVRHHLHGHHRSQARRGRRGPRPRGGGGGELGQERVPRQHEPRDPHADERASSACRSWRSRPSSTPSSAST